MPAEGGRRAGAATLGGPPRRARRPRLQRHVPGRARRGKRAHPLPLAMPARPSQRLPEVGLAGRRDVRGGVGPGGGPPQRLRAGGARAAPSREAQPRGPGDAGGRRQGPRPGPPVGRRLLDRRAAALRLDDAGLEPLGRPAPSLASPRGGGGRAGRPGQHAPPQLPVQHALRRDELRAGLRRPRPRHLGDLQAGPSGLCRKHHPEVQVSRAQWLGCEVGGCLRVAEAPRRRRAGSCAHQVLDRARVRRRPAKRHLSGRDLHGGEAPVLGGPRGRRQRPGPAGRGRVRGAAAGHGARRPPPGRGLSPPRLRCRGAERPPRRRVRLAHPLGRRRRRAGQARAPDGRARHPQGHPRPARDRLGPLHAPGV
mmetsp:Transcript_62009/g.195617  ORF Transcript_62009/g.195617 Transcript_62009/m.195617 type:complete len:367 (+) Transcript_62009:231-1331(+)